MLRQSAESLGELGNGHVYNTSIREGDHNVIGIPRSRAYRAGTETGWSCNFTVNEDNRYCYWLNYSVTNQAA